MDFEIGRMLYEARLAAGFAQQADLALQLGVKQQTVSRWEQGLSKPRASQLAQIADVLNIDLAVLSNATGRAVRSSPQATFDQPWPLDALSPSSFERFCTDFLRKHYLRADVHRYGDQGHKQEGLDIEVLFSDGSIFSFQCKRHTAFGPKKITEAVAAHTKQADKKIILLSSIASPQSREAIKKFPNWELWDREDISANVRQNLSKIDQRILVDIYFAGQHLALLGELESSPWRTSESFFAGMLASHRGFSHAWKLVGREHELSDLSKFAAADYPPAIILVGNGGSGKTRLLKGFSDQIESLPDQPALYFLSRETLTTKSLDGLGNGRKLLICDDAHERDDMGMLFDYVSNPRNNSRLIVGIRRYGLPHLMQQARALSISEMPVIDLPKLGKEESESLAQQALKEYNGDPSYVEALAKYTRDCPLATVIGAEILSSGSTFPEFLMGEEEFRNELMRRLVREIVSGVSKGLDENAVSQTLGAIALLQPIQEGDNTLSTALAGLSGIKNNEVARILKRLKESGVLFKRGAQSRIAPDLLADFIIEDHCINGNGKSTGFSEAVFDSVPDAYAENILLNLGRLDWRKSNGDTRQSRLLNQLWERLTWHEKYYTPHLKAAEAVAYYQPRQALNFARRLMHDGHTEESVVRIIRNAAYNYEYLPDACDLLWQIGCNDRQPRNQNPSHGIRILTELAEPGPNKQVGYIDSIVEFGLSLLPSDQNWINLYSPLDFLGGVLSTEGHTTTSTHRAFTMTPFVVSPSAMVNSRKKVVDAAIGLLSHPSTNRGYRAATLLHSALRYPMRASTETQEMWTAQFCETLLDIDNFINGNTISPVILIRLAESVSWHAIHHTGPTQITASAIINKLDADLRVRTIRMLLDGWGHMTREIDEEGNITGHEERLRKIAEELFTAYKTPADLRIFLNNCLNELLEAGADRQGSPHILLNTLLDKSPPFAEELLLEAIKNPKSPVAQFASASLTKVLESLPSLGQKIVSEIVASEDETKMEWVAAAYGRYTPSTGQYSDIDKSALWSIVKSNKFLVVINGAHAANKVSHIDRTFAVELITSANLSLESRVTHAYLMWLCHETTIPFDSLSLIQIRKVLDGIMPLENLDDHWVQEFLRKILARYPAEALMFFKKRIDYAAELDGWQYRPVSYGPYRYKSLEIMNLDSAGLYIKDLLDSAYESVDNYKVLHYYGHLFEALAAPFNSRFVEILEDWSFSKSGKHLDVVLAVLREASNNNFIFDYESFTSGLLRWAKSLGENVLQKTISALFVTTISGMRSGSAGEPFPQDIQLAKSSQEALDSIGRFDPGYKLYAELLEHANQQINSARLEGLQQDEEDN